MTIHHKKPTYYHDCASCIFLGFTIGRGQVVDLYAHPSSGHTTLLARYGDDGHEYFSALSQHVNPECCHSELFVAQTIWESM